MATYYWVSGAGTWDATSTTNWATSTGGAGGAGVPTSSDDVIFDTNSGTGTVTVTGASAVCRDFTVTATQALTFSGSLYDGANAYTKGCYGNFSIASVGSTVFTGFQVSFMSGTTGKAITTGGKTLSTILFAGIGGEWTLQDSLTTNSSLNFNNANTFNTNGFAVSATTLSAGNSSTTFNFGSSTITFSGATVTFSTTNTVNAGTSTIVCSGSGASFTGANKTFYNVSFTGSGTTTVNIINSNTFNNLSFTAASGIKPVSLRSNQTINGTLSVSGTTVANRISFVSNTIGTQRTITVATAGTLTNTDWTDINFAGAASPWSAPFGVRDLGNNSGITFDTTPLYWVGGTGNWNDGTKWSTSSGGSAANALPGGQTNVIFDGNSGAGTSTINAQSYCKDANFAGYTGTLAGSSELSVFGSWAFSAGMTSSLANIITFAALTTGKTITSAGKSFSSVVFNGVGGEWTLQDNFSTTTGYTATFSAGTFNTNNYNITTGYFVYTTSTSMVLNLGSSTITIGSSGLNLIGSGLTVNAGTSTFLFTGNSLIKCDKTLYNVSFTPSSHTQTLRIITNPLSVSNNLTIIPSGALTYVTTLSVETDLTVGGTFTATGLDAARRIMVGDIIGSATSGTARTITANAASLSYVDFRYISGAGAATWSGTSIGDIIGNSGITFTAPKTVYWSLAGGGNWASATGWATTSGGTPSIANYPLPQDTAIIDDAGLNASATISVGTTNIKLPNIDFSSRTLAMTFSTNASAYLAGDIVWDANVTSSGTSSLSVFGSTDMTTAGVTQAYGLQVLVGSTLTLIDSFTGTDVVGNQGTITLGANAAFYQLSLGAVSTTNFSTYKISLTGNAIPLFTGNATQTVTGNAVIDCTYSGSSGTRTITAAGPTEANSIAFNITAGTDAVTVSGTVKSLDFTGHTAGTVNINSVTIRKSLTLTSGITLSPEPYLTFNGTTTGNTVTTAGKTIADVVFTGGGTWTLQDAFTVTSNFTVRGGATVNTNNNNITQTSISYVVIIGYPATTESGNIDFGTSTVTCAGLSAFGSSSSISASNATFVTVKGIANYFAPAFAVLDCSMSDATSGYFCGVSSVRNLTIAASTISTRYVLTGSFTCTGTFTSSGNSSYRTVFTTYENATTAQTITAAAVSLQYTDFCKITGAGAATWSGTSLADGGGCSDITFNVTPRTLYWVGGTGAYSPTNTANWSLSSGGASGEAPPRICDSVIVDSSSGTGTMTISSGQTVPDIQFTTANITLAGSPNIFGDISLYTGMAASGAWSVYGYNQTVSQNSATFTGSFGSYASASTTTLGSALNLASQGLAINAGTFTTNNYPITALSFNAAGQFYTTVNMGSSIVTTTTASSSLIINNVAYGQLTTFNAGTSEFIITRAGSANITINNTTLNKLTDSTSPSTSIFTVNGTGNTIANLSSTRTTARTMRFLGGSTNTINDWNISGTSGNVVAVTSTTTTPFTLVSGGSGTQGADYLNISYSTATPSLTWYAGANSTDSGNNTGWIFAAEPGQSGNGLFFGSNF